METDWGDTSGPLLGSVSIMYSPPSSPAGPSWTDICLGIPECSITRALSQLVGALKVSPRGQRLFYHLPNVSVAVAIPGISGGLKGI